MLSAFSVLSLVLAATANLLNDPQFAEGFARWRVEAGAAHAEIASLDGLPALSIHGDTAEGYPRVVQDFAVTPGALYGARVDSRGDSITGGYGAYMTVEFLGADGKRIQFEQSSPALPGEAWTPLIARVVAPPDAARGMFCLVLRGAGTAWFRAPVLTQLEDAPPLESPDEISLHFAPARKEPFLGFGVEDDGWSANANNRAKGVTEEDLALNGARTAWINPALVRMFFWYKDFNPSGDWQTFDFDTDNMKSHYRALDLYQKLGATVDLTGVEWGIKQPWARPEAMASAIGALFTELVAKRGYTCIKKWTLTNEPNTHFVQEGGTFEIYSHLHTLAAKEFAARGLNISITGSDDTNGGLPWFQQCVADPEYFNLLGSIASHFYLQKDSLRAGKYHVQDRLDLLAGRKPFVIAEFGFQDPRATFASNPLMDEFDYALLAAAFACDSVAAGTSGLTIWCLHETEYPGTHMNYGLWRDKSQNWSPRPVFYAWSLLTRNTRPGQPVRPAAEPLPPALSALRIGDTLFFVNQGAPPVRLSCGELRLHEARAVIEADLPALGAAEDLVRQAAEGRTLPIDMGTFTVPGRSFGRAW